jgi:hypothetical protein
LPTFDRLIINLITVNLDPDLHHLLPPQVIATEEYHHDVCDYIITIVAKAIAKCVIVLLRMNFPLYCLLSRIRLLSNLPLHLVSFMVTTTTVSVKSFAFLILTIGANHDFHVIFSLSAINALTFELFTSREFIISEKDSNSAD